MARPTSQHAHRTACRPGDASGLGPETDLSSIRHVECRANLKPELNQSLVIESACHVLRGMY
eukprot:2796095-Rhodomonas_salina.1